MSICFCLSVSLSVCLCVSVCLSICLSVYLSLSLSVPLSLSPSLSLSQCLYVSLCLCLCLSVSLSVWGWGGGGRATTWRMERQLLLDTGFKSTGGKLCSTQKPRIQAHKCMRSSPSQIFLWVVFSLAVEVVFWQDVKNKLTYCMCV